MSTKKKMIWGVFYTAISKYSSILISIGIGAILSRLLSPTEFGIVAIVIIFITFFNMLSDFGFGPAIIQNQNLDDKDIKSLFSLSLIFGSVFALLFFLLAPMIADFYSNQQLIDISRLLSICVLFYSFSVVPKALCTKKLLFKKIAVISLLIQLFSGGMAVFFALNGYSYYSLIYKSILDAFLSFLSFFILVPIKITFNIKLSSLNKILKFSVYQFMFNFINYFSRNADNLLIGRYFGASPLGYYNKSYQLMLMPVQNLTHVITPVLFPVLSEFQNDKSKIFSSYCRVVQLLAIIGFPLSVFLFFSAPDLINILFGVQWQQSIPIFKVLSLTVGIQIVLSSSGSIFQAANRTDLLFFTGVLHSIFMVSGICFGIFYMKDMIYVCYGLLIAFILGFLNIFIVLVKIALNSSFVIFIKLFVKPVFFAISLAIVLYFNSNLIIENIFYSLIEKIAISCLVFSLCWISFSSNRILLITRFRKIGSK